MKQKTNIFNLIYQLFINWAETRILETFKIVLVVIVQKKTKSKPHFWSQTNWPLICEFVEQQNTHTS